VQYGDRVSTLASRKSNAAPGTLAYLAAYPEALTTTLEGLSKEEKQAIQSWPKSGMRKAHRMNKRESKYLHLPDTPLGSSCLSQCIRNSHNLPKVIKAFLADIKMTMGVQAFMLVGYIDKDENPHSAT